MNKNYWFAVGSAALLTACASSRPATSTEPPILATTSVGKEYYENARRTVEPFVLQEISTDSTYGFTSKNPVNVGGGFESGARNQQRYLNALRGPGGQPVTYERRGSCCMFKTAHGLNGMGLLDAYLVSWEGNAKPKVLYLNLYDEGWLKAPKGFTVAR